jgi:hypothetical protein
LQAIFSAGKEATDLLLAGIEEVPGWCLVDGIGPLLAEVLETGPELIAEILWGELGLRVHGTLHKQGRMGSMPHATRVRREASG